MRTSLWIRLGRSPAQPPRVTFGARYVELPQPARSFESETNQPGQRTAAVTIRFRHGGVVSRLAAQAVEQAVLLVRALNLGTLLISYPRRYPEFYKPQRDRLGALVGKTPIPRGAEIGVRVR